MKLLKKTALVILVFAGLLALVSFFLPGRIHVRRTIAINAPDELVFNQVNNLKNWKNWSYWDNLDKEMKSVYEGPESGTGSVHKWTSNNEQVGIGSLTITESVPNSKILNSLQFGEMVTNGGWEFVKGKDGVQADFYMDMDIPFYARIFPGLMLDSWLGADFEKSLAGLKGYSEKLVADGPIKWNIEKVRIPETPVLTTKVACAAPEFRQKLEETFTLLMDELVKQGLQPAGAQYAVYHVWSPDSVVMIQGIPVNKPGLSKGNVTAEMRPASDVIQVNYFGDDSEKAHIYMDEWATKNNATITGPPMEEYLISHNGEADPTRWHTRISYPVGAP